MTTIPEFIDNWVNEDYQLSDTMQSDLSQLINDEIERRIAEAEKTIEIRIRQGLYTNTDGYPDNVFRLGFSYLKSKLIRK